MDVEELVTLVLVQVDILVMQENVLVLVYQVVLEKLVELVMDVEELVIRDLALQDKLVMLLEVVKIIP